MKKYLSKLKESLTDTEYIGLEFIGLQLLIAIWILILLVAIGMIWN